VVTIFIQGGHPFSSKAATHFHESGHLKKQPA
jgi:hypothetical protein